MAPIRIAGLVDWEGFKGKSDKQQEELKRERGFSKSGLDWEETEETKDPSAPENWEEMAENVINEKIEKRGDEWVVLSKDGGKVLGTHDTKEDAVDQLQAIEASKDESRKPSMRLSAIIKEWGLDEEGEDDEMIENRDLKALVKSIHKHAAELYNQLDEMDDPEDWVMEKAKDCAAKIAEIHSHIDYNKGKAEELNTEPGAGQAERGW